MCWSEILSEGSAERASLSFSYMMTARAFTMFGIGAPSKWVIVTHWGYVNKLKFCLPSDLKAPPLSPILGFDI